MSDALDLGITTARITTLRLSPAALLDLARERAPDPAIFERSPPFFWPAEISSTRLDSYFGHMAEDTLRNFAADARSGVAFLEGHRWWTTPFGSSLSGELLPAGDGVARVVADFFTLPGLVIDGGQGRTSDDFIRRVGAGIQRDVSVGFHIGPRADGSRGRYVCDVCGGNLMDWRACPHIPGLSYEITDERGATRTQLATFAVFNGSLSEVSAVYDGATPGASILKARQAAEDGQLNERQIHLLEAHYRCALPARRSIHAGATVPPATPEEEPVPPEPTPAEERATPPAVAGLDLPTIRTLFGLSAEADPEAFLQTLAAELPQIRAEAELGRATVEEARAAAVAEAVRAYGPEAEERYTPVVAALPLAAVRAMAADWATVAAQRLPGGRVSQDQPDPAPETPPAPAPGATPDAAYRA